MWLATGSGLYRFDGRRFERQAAPVGSQFPSTNMVTLAHAADGALWIGYFQAGISRFAQDGCTATAVSRGAGRRGAALQPDRDGQLWAAINGGLRRFDGHRWQPLPAAAGLPEHRVQWVLHDSRGRFWVLAGLKIWMRAAGQTAFEDTGIAVSQMATLAESPQGEVWLADRVRGTSPLANAQGLLADSEREARRLPELVAARLQFTADGALWATMSPHGGVAHITFAGTRAVRMERFDSPQGLTATSAVPIIVDREGNLWIGTNLGLNRFRARSVHTRRWVQAIPTARWYGPAMAACMAMAKTSSPTTCGAPCWMAAPRSCRLPRAVHPRRSGSSTGSTSRARSPATPH